MSAPRCKDLKALKRIARYLVGKPRVVYDFPFQQSADISAFVDTDWAGCATTCRSTSGGCLQIGRHLIKHWSSTQKTIALSSGEAELAGIVKGCAEGLGMISIAQDLGIQVGLEVYTDSSAAIGICRRTGVGRVRHLAVGQLWVQERVREGELKLHKHPGLENPADVLTKHLPKSECEGHVQRLSLSFEDGRAESAPTIDR